LRVQIDRHRIVPIHRGRRHSSAAYSQATRVDEFLVPREERLRLVACVGDSHRRDDPLTEGLGVAVPIVAGPTSATWNENFPSDGGTDSRGAARRRRTVYFVAAESRQCRAVCEEKTQ
jgi:hypothetical protein